MAIGASEIGRSPWYHRKPCTGPAAWRSYRLGLRRGHASAHNPPPGALTLINSAKTAPAACPSVLRDAGLSGGTHFAELQITTSGSLSLRAANEGRLELAGEVPGVVRGLAKVGMTMIIVTHEVLYEVLVGQGPPGWAGPSRARTHAAFPAQGRP